jgi:hypothetical protein
MYRCEAGHEALHDDGKCHAAVLGKECGLSLTKVRRTIGPLLYHVYGTVDDDQLLSLRFGDAAQELMPKWVENYLCDVFWKGEMSVALIETFGRGNTSVDFKLTVDPDGLHCWLWEAEAGGWKLDRKDVAARLRIATPVQICSHDLQRIMQGADNTPVAKQEEKHDGQDEVRLGRTPDDSGVRRP